MLPFVFFYLKEPVILMIVSGSVSRFSDLQTDQFPYDIRDIRSLSKNYIAALTKEFVVRIRGPKSNNLSFSLTA